MSEGLEGRLNEALLSTPTHHRAAQWSRALVLLQRGLVPAAGLERWFNDGAAGDLGRFLIDHGYADEATLERERLFRDPASPAPAELHAARADRVNRIGPYLRLSRIAGSADGSVWRAFDERDGRVVALRLPADPASPLVDAARAMLGLAVPGVIAVLDAGRRGGHACIAAELVPGTSLREWSFRHERPIGATLDLLRPVARAVHRAHERGYLHRAITPENILVASSGDEHHAVIGDFGMRGAPAYWSPEQVRDGPTSADRRSDVYSLGAVLFDALCGRPPYEGAPTGIGQAMAGSPPPPLHHLRPDVPEPVSRVVARCLEHDPARRFATAAELEWALVRACIDLARPDPADGEDVRIESTAPPGRPDIAVVTIAGALSNAAGRRLAEHLRPLRERGARHVVLDLSRVRFVSSGGVSCLIALADELRGAEGSVTLAGPRTHVRVALVTLGLDAWMTIAPSLVEAFRAIAPGLPEPTVEPVVTGSTTLYHISARLERTVELTRELSHAATLSREEAAEKARRLLWRIETLLRADEREPHHHLLRGRALLMLGDANRAAPELRRGRDAESADALERHFQKVEAAWRGSAPGREAVPDGELNRADLLHLRALRRRADGRLDEARQDLLRALELTAGAGELHVTLGLVTRELGDPEGGRRQFAQALLVTAPDWPLRPCALEMGGPMPIADLSSDRRLAGLPRDDVGRPLLAGIPLVRRLGSGGMGSVYYAVHPRLDREVAVKVLHPHLAESDPSLVERFRAEGGVAAGLQSEHVVRVLEVGEAEGLHYLVMPFVRGRTAAERLQRVRGSGKPGLDEAEALLIVTAAARGLAAAHERGIIHRDVKPQNILIPDGNPSRAMLADLGLAKPLAGDASTATQAGLTLGSPGFVAPEQATDARLATPASDVFSMGCTLHALLAGTPAFKGSGVFETLVKTATTEPDPLPARVSERTRAIVARCLRKDPTQRYPDATALLRALEDASAHLGKPAPSPSRRYRWRAAAAAGVVAMVGAALLLWPRGESPAVPRLEWRFERAFLADGLLRDVSGRHAGRVEGAVDFHAEGFALFDGAAVVIADDIRANRALLPTRAFSVAAWVSVAKPVRWGGFIGAMQDNGGAEKGWVLGYDERGFSFGLATAGADDGDGDITYLSAGEHVRGRWHHVAGTYDGERMALYVDGRIVAWSRAQSGDILYPGVRTPFVLGAYRDRDEDFRLHGWMRSACLEWRAWSEEEVAAMFRAERRAE